MTENQTRLDVLRLLLGRLTGEPVADERPVVVESPPVEDPGSRRLAILRSMLERLSA